MWLNATRAIERRQPSGLIVIGHIQLGHRCVCRCRPRCDPQRRRHLRTCKASDVGRRGNRASVDQRAIHDDSRPRQSQSPAAAWSLLSGLGGIGLLGRRTGLVDTFVRTEIWTAVDCGGPESASRLECRINYPKADVRRIR
jgi:hypothetical protein